MLVAGVLHLVRGPDGGECEGCAELASEGADACDGAKDQRVLVEGCAKCLQEEQQRD